MKYIHTLVTLWCLLLNGGETSILKRLSICKQCRCSSLTIECNTLPNSQSLLQIKNTPHGSTLNLQNIPKSDFERLDIFKSLLQRLFTNVILPPADETTSMVLTTERDKYLPTMDDWVTNPEEASSILTTTRRRSEHEFTTDSHMDRIKIDTVKKMDTEEIYNLLYWKLNFPDAIVLCVSLVSLTVACCNLCTTYIHVRACRNKVRKWMARGSSLRIMARATPRSTPVLPEEYELGSLNQNSFLSEESEATYENIV